MGIAGAPGPPMRDRVAWQWPRAFLDGEFWRSTKSSGRGLEENSQALPTSGETKPLDVQSHSASSSTSNANLNVNGGPFAPLAYLPSNA